MKILFAFVVCLFMSFQSFASTFEGKCAVQAAQAVIYAVFPGIKARYPEMTVKDIHITSSTVMNSLNSYMYAVFFKLPRNNDRVPVVTHYVVYIDDTQRCTIAMVL